jgi:hypothetical protein
MPPPGSARSRKEELIALGQAHSECICNDPHAAWLIAAGTHCPELSGKPVSCNGQWYGQAAGPHQEG